jgi:hypothetical protein
MSKSLAMHGIWEACRKLSKALATQTVQAFIISLETRARYAMESVAKTIFLILDDSDSRGFLTLEEVYCKKQNFFRGNECVIWRNLFFLRI